MVEPVEDPGTKVSSKLGLPVVVGTLIAILLAMFLGLRTPGGAALLLIICVLGSLIIRAIASAVLRKIGKRA